MDIQVDSHEEGAGETELASGTIDIGARSYVPQLGRFLQPDPQPGGSANAYAYTHGNPLNESDPSGEWSLNETSGDLSAVGTGEGVQLQGGTGIASGAVMPAPVNTQMEEAFWAAPPWDQVTAGGEEYEEYEEEGEYGTEYAAYHQNREEAERDASFGPGVIVTVAATESGENSREGRSESAPEVKCDGGGEGESTLTASPGGSRREYVSANQCLAQKSYPQGRKWGHIKAIRGIGGHYNSWRDVGDVYCAVATAAALVPGVDILGAPATVACAGYGVFRAIEIVVG